MPNSIVHSLTLRAPPQIALFYGGEDKLTCKEDVERLISELPKESVVYVQYEEEYGHLDFVWGDDSHIRFARLPQK